MTGQNPSPHRLSEIAASPDDLLLRVAEAAALDGISMATAWRRIRSGVWNPVRIGGTTRLPLGEVRRARATSAIGAAPDADVQEPRNAGQDL